MRLSSRRLAPCGGSHTSGMARPLGALLAALLLPVCMAHVRVLAYGDSLTAGFWDGGRQFHPYSMKLSECARSLRFLHVSLLSR